MSSPVVAPCRRCPSATSRQARSSVTVLVPNSPALKVFVGSVACVADAVGPVRRQGRRPTGCPLPVRLVVEELLACRRRLSLTMSRPWRPGVGEGALDVGAGHHLEAHAVGDAGLLDARAGRAGQRPAVRHGLGDRLGAELAGAEGVVLVVGIGAVVLEGQGGPEGAAAGEGEVEELLALRRGLLDDADLGVLDVGEGALDVGAGHHLEAHAVGDAGLLDARAGRAGQRPAVRHGLGDRLGAELAGAEGVVLVVGIGAVVLEGQGGPEGAAAGEGEVEELLALRRGLLDDADLGVLDVGEGAGDVHTCGDLDRRGRVTAGVGILVAAVVAGDVS